MHKIKQAIIFFFFCFSALHSNAQDGFIGIRSGLADINFYDITKDMVVNQHPAQIVLHQFSNTPVVALDFFNTSQSGFIWQFDFGYKKSDLFGDVGGKEYTYQSLGYNTMDTAFRIRSRTEVYDFKMGVGQSLLNSNHGMCNFVLAGNIAYGEETYFTDISNSVYSVYNNSPIDSVSKSALIYGVCLKMNCGFSLGSDGAQDIFFVVTPALAFLWKYGSGMKPPLTPDLTVAVFKRI